MGKSIRRPGSHATFSRAVQSELCLFSPTPTPLFILLKATSSNLTPKPKKWWRFTQRCWITTIRRRKILTRIFSAIGGRFVSCAAPTSSSLGSCARGHRKDFSRGGAIRVKFHFSYSVKPREKHASTKMFIAKYEISKSRGKCLLYPLSNAHGCAAFTTLPILDDAFQSSGVEIFPLRKIHVVMQLNTGKIGPTVSTNISLIRSAKLVNYVTEVKNFVISSCLLFLSAPHFPAQVMTSEERGIVTDLGRCDFTAVSNYFKMKSEERKARSKEEKLVSQTCQAYRNNVSETEKQDRSPLSILNKPFET